MDKLFSKYDSDIKDNKINIDKKISSLKLLNTKFEKDLINEYNTSKKETYDK